MHWLLLSCKKATELIEKRSFIGLKLLDRIRLQWHLRLCEACSLYESHSKQIDHMMQHTHTHTPSSTPSEALAAQAFKERLIKALHDADASEK